MEIKHATAALAALGQITRLSVFRLLVEAGPEGLMAGDIAERLGLPGATLSFHLKELSNAQLVEGEQQGRFICYRADFARMSDLIAFLTQDCCGGKTVAACMPAKKRAARPSKARVAS